MQIEIILVEAKRRAIQRKYGPFFPSGAFYQTVRGIRPTPPAPPKIISGRRWNPRFDSSPRRVTMGREKENERRRNYKRRRMLRRMEETKSASGSDSMSVSSAFYGEEDIR